MPPPWLFTMPKLSPWSPWCWRGDNAGSACGVGLGGRLSLRRVRGCQKVRRGRRSWRVAPRHSTVARLAPRRPRGLCGVLGVGVFTRRRVGGCTACAAADGASRAAMENAGQMAATRPIVVLGLLGCRLADSRTGAYAPAQCACAASVVSGAMSKLLAALCGSERARRQVKRERGGELRLAAEAVTVWGEWPECLHSVVRRRCGLPRCPRHRGTLPEVTLPVAARRRAQVRPHRMLLQWEARQ